MQDFEKIFKERAGLQRRKIAVAILRPIPETVESLKKATAFADVVVVGAKVDGFENIVEADEDKAAEILLDLLKDKKVDGIVRGQVKDTSTLDLFFKKFNKKPIPSNHKVFISLMKKGDYAFIPAGCSVYHGMTIEDKIFEVERIIKYMREELKTEPKIGVLGILRPTSKHGKYPVIDNISQQCTEFYNYLVGKGYDAKEYFMEYETAVWEGCNLIVPSIGFVGNSWLKALLYLGDWKMLNCCYLDLGVVYEDGSRNEKDYFYHIVHAVAMCNKDL